MKGVDADNVPEFGTRYTKTSCILYIDTYTIPKNIKFFNTRYIHDNLCLQLSIVVQLF